MMLINVVINIIITIVVAAIILSMYCMVYKYNGLLEFEDSYEIRDNLGNVQKIVTYNPKGSFENAFEKLINHEVESGNFDLIKNSYNEYKDRCQEDLDSYIHIINLWHFDKSYDVKFFNPNTIRDEIGKSEERLKDVNIHTNLMSYYHKLLLNNIEKIKASGIRLN